MGVTRAAPELVIPYERWCTKDLRRLKPEEQESAQYMMVIAVDDTHVLVDAYQSGICIAQRDKFLEAFDKDYDPGDGGRRPTIDAMRKMYHKYKESVCKHGVTILLTGLKINKSCKDCYPEKG